RRQQTGMREIADNGRFRCAGRNVEDVLTRDFSLTEPSAIGRIADFQCTPFDIGTVSSKKLLNVIPVYWCAAIQTKAPADRPAPAEVSEINFPNRRCRTRVQLEASPHRGDKVLSNRDW